MVQSDAFVFFGATGDLAFKQIFPALADLIRDDGFDLPIIGVARSGDLDSPQGAGPGEPGREWPPRRAGPGPPPGPAALRQG